MAKMKKVLAIAMAAAMGMSMLAAEVRARTM